MQTKVRSLAKAVLPLKVRHWLRAKQRNLRRLAARPPIGKVDMGKLRRPDPIGKDSGYQRGLPVDRYFIEHFLSENVSDIRGRVLETGSAFYTKTFGKGVTRSDVLHVEEGNPNATIVADLSQADDLAPDTFDCIILTQTLPFIYDVNSTIRTVHRILKPDGVVLATTPGISQISRNDMDRWGDYWRFTSLSARKLFEEAFDPAWVSVDAYGNALVAIAFLHGLACDELTDRELLYRHPDYEVTITVRARKDHVVMAGLTLAMIVGPRFLARALDVINEVQGSPLMG